MHAIDSVICRQALFRAAVIYTEKSLPLFSGPIMPAVQAKMKHAQQGQAMEQAEDPAPGQRAHQIVQAAVRGNC